MGQRTVVGEAILKCYTAQKLGNLSLVILKKVSGAKNQDTIKAKIYYTIYQRYTII